MTSLYWIRAQGIIAVKTSGAVIQEHILERKLLILISSFHDDLNFRPLVHLLFQTGSHQDFSSLHAAQPHIHDDFDLRPLIHFPFPAVSHHDDLNLRTLAHFLSHTVSHPWWPWPQDSSTLPVAHIHYYLMSYLITFYSLDSWIINLLNEAQGFHKDL